MIQLKDHMKLNRKEGPSMKASMSFTRGNKIITGGRWRKGPEWKREEKAKGLGISCMGADRR